MKFKVINEKTYEGPNVYLSKQAVTFEIFKIEQTQFEQIKNAGIKQFSSLKNENNFFYFIARSIIEVQKLGPSNLYPHNFNVVDKKESAIIAIEYLERGLGWRCTDFVLNWYEAVLNKMDFDFQTLNHELALYFRKTICGGPTIYSILESAYKRKIPIRLLETENVFQFGYGKNQQRSRSTILSSDSYKDTEFTCQKDMCKNFMEKMDFPIPKGDVVTTVKGAVKAVEKLGFPVVVKPVEGHKGIGVTTNIQTLEELKFAVETLINDTEEEPDIIVEKYITGTDHRLLVIGGKFAAALQRVPAFVIGDGEKTILELIRIENTKPERDESNPRAPINQIIVDKIMDDFLKENYNYVRNTVLKKGEKIFLRGIANISGGGVSINVTDIVHPDNVKLAATIAEYLLIGAFGIDVLTDDISKSWKDPDNSFAIIELNAGPGIMMHTAPAIGEPIDTPGIIWKNFYPTFESSRVPIIIFNRVTPEVISKYTKIIKENTKFKKIGFSSHQGVYINGEWVFNNHEDYSTNVLFLLRNPKLDIALIEYDSEEIKEHSLYYEKSDAVIFDYPNNIEKEILTRELLPDGITLDASDEKGFVELVKRLYTKYNPDL